MTDTESLRQQSRAAREGALVVPAPELGCLRVRGPDRKSWLNGIVTCDVAEVSEQRGAFGLSLTKQGKINSDLNIVANAEELFVSVAAGKSLELCAFLDRMLIMEDAELEDASAALAWITLHGPRAVELAQAVPAVAQGRIDWTGLGGVALVAQRASLDDTVACLIDAGAERASEEGFLQLRIERTLPAYGVDYTDADNPHQAWLDQRAVNWQKGCYLGQEVVCMQDMRGKVKRRLALLELSAEQAPAAGAVVTTLAGEQAGEVTSVAYSTRLDGYVALARLSTAHVEPGTELAVDGAGARVRVQV